MLIEKGKVIWLKVETETKYSRVVLFPTALTRKTFGNEGLHYLNSVIHDIA